MGHVLAVLSARAHARRGCAALVGAVALVLGAHASARADATPGGRLDRPLVTAPFLSDGLPLSGGAPRSFEVSSNRLSRLEHDGALLEIDPGALTEPRTISIQPLASGAVPRLDPGMTNVTGGAPAGYRFLPHMR